MHFEHSSTRPAMSSALRHPLPVNSDESNSTEHDATVSLSGTDELNDNQSIFSDAGSRASRVNDTRKAIHKMNKLKEENAVLKEALEKANAADITTLKSKLRGSHADLVRLRQNNSELKDRIQMLEGRLFSALSLTSTAVKNTNDTITGSDAERDTLNAIEAETTLPTHFSEPPAKERFTSGDRAHLMDMIRSLQSRCKHLARLVQSYETKMSVLQSEVDGSKQFVTTAFATPHNNTPTHSIDFTLDTIYQNKEQAFSASNELSTGPLKSALKGKPTDAHTLSLQTPPVISDLTTHNTDINNQTTATTTVSTFPTTTTRKVQMGLQKEEIATQIQQARAADMKLIRELSNEVRRLVALVPREKMDYNDNNGIIHNDNKESEFEKGDGTESEPEDSETDTISKPSTIINVSKVTSQATMDTRITPTTQETTNPVSMHTESKKAHYTHGDVLCSFFVGVFVMLLCVALSTYFASSLTDLKPVGKI